MGGLDHRGVLESIISGRDLSLREAYYVASHLLAEDLDDVIKAAILTALRAKGEAPEEVAGFAMALRDACLKVRYEGRLLDTAGTGGDGSHTINASTSAALVAASLGARVAKHGNRSVSSKSGSADFMEELGYKIDHGPEEAECMLERAGFAFLYAPIYHRAMKSVMPVRRSLGIRTIFNLVGPLSNPAGAARQVMGVASRGLVGLMASSASLLGYEKLVIVYGYPGIDEVSVSGETLVLEVEGPRARDPYKVFPEDLGLRRHGIGELKVASPKESAARALRVFRGRGNRSDREFIAANAGMALYAAGMAGDPRDGVELALKSIDDGIVSVYIDRLLEVQRRCLS